MPAVQGTFSAPGQSEVMYRRQVDVSLRFPGAASVDVELQMPSGNWIKLEAGIVADYHKVFDSGTNQTIRLNATSAAASSCEYSLKPGD